MNGYTVIGFYEIFPESAPRTFPAGRLSSSAHLPAYLRIIEYDQRIDGNRFVS